MVALAAAPKNINFCYRDENGDPSPPGPKQLIFHSAREKFKLFGGAMAGGKSSTVCAEAIMLGLEFPGNCILIARKTFRDLKRTTMRTFFELLPEDLIASKNKQDGIYTLFNKTEFMFSDLEHIHKLKSLNLGAFVIDEATEATEEAFLMLASRLRKKLPRIRYKGLLATNPEPGWVKDRFVSRKLADHVYVPASPYDNKKNLPDGYIEEMERDFPEVWRAKYLQGSWDNFGGQIFDPKYLFPTKGVVEYAAKFMAIDPAISEDYEADETAICVVGIGYDGLLHEIETAHGRWSFHEQIKQIEACYARHNPQLIGVEVVQYQKALEESLRALSLPVVGLIPDGNKIRRAITVSNLFEKGLVRINTQALRTQLMEFPKGVHDDLVDALVWCLRLIRSHSEEKYDKPENPHRGLDPRSLVFWKDYHAEMKRDVEGDNEAFLKIFQL